MEQQTSHSDSLDTSSLDRPSNSSLMLGDHKQVSVVFLKSALTKKLQQLFSIAFRKISNNNPVTRFEERKRDCQRSVNKSERKLLRENSQTERHSISAFQTQDDAMCFSEDVKTVLSEIYKSQKLSQIIDGAKRIQEVVGLEAKRLQKLKNREKWKDRFKVYDTELAAVCIEKLLCYIAQFNTSNEDVLAYKIEIDASKDKNDQTLKSTKQKDSKLRLDDNLSNKQNQKAIETLVTIMRDHKISNIKRKIQQESKKFSQARKELFDGILSSISKTETFQLTNLSQITQLSAKLLQEQPTVEKTISYIQKQKRVIQKLIHETKNQESKVAHYNLIETSTYLIKLLSNQKDNKIDKEKARSPPRIRKPVSSKTGTKDKPSITKQKIVQIQPFKEDVVLSKQQYSVSSSVSSLINSLFQIKQRVDRQQPINQQIIEKQQNEEFKKVLCLFCDMLQNNNKQKDDLKSFIETLSFDIQNLKVRQQSLQQIISSKQHSNQQLIDIIQDIKQIIGNTNINIPYNQVGQELSRYIESVSNTSLNILLSSFLLSLNRSIDQCATPSPPQQLIDICPQLTILIDKLNNIFSQNQINIKKYLNQTDKSKQLQSQLNKYVQQVSNKTSQISYLKNSIQGLRQQVYHLRKQVPQNTLKQLEVQQLKLQITHLKTQKTDFEDNQLRQLQYLRQSKVEGDNKIQTLELLLNQQKSQFQSSIRIIEDKYLSQKHILQLQSTRLAEDCKQITNKNTILQSDIFLYKREIDCLKAEYDKAQTQISQEEVDNLRQENAILRQDVIEKGKILQDFEVGQLSPRSNVSGSLHSILEMAQTTEEAFKKKNSNSSSDILKDFAYNQEKNFFLEKEIVVLKQKVSQMHKQKVEHERTINEINAKTLSYVSQIKSMSSQIQQLQRQIQELKESEAKTQQRLQEYQIEEGSMIMKNPQKWNPQQSYLDSLDSHSGNQKGSKQNLNDNQLLMKINFLQGQLYNKGSKLIKSNLMREQDLKILMSENQLLQQEVQQINSKLASERIKVVISVKSLEDSMRKMEFQLSKLKQEGQILKEQLKQVSNPNPIIKEQETVYVPPVVMKPVKSSYEFVTKKFSNSNSSRSITKLTSLPASPRASKLQNQFKQMESQKASLISRVKLLSVFTIIDEENKAFVHNINKIISCLLEFLSTAQQFQQCDYTDVDYMSTLTQYLTQQDYQGYFQTLQTFFKDLFLNVFDRKNSQIIRQAEQLMFLKDKMQMLLSERIDQIEQEEQKLSYNRRLPLNNYNEDKGGIVNTRPSWKRV